MTENNSVDPQQDPQDDTGETTPEGADFAAFEEDFGDGSELLKVQGELEEAKDELARSQAETYNVRQEYANFVRRSKAEAANRKVEARVDVVEELLPILDDIEAARAAGALEEGPFAAIADKFDEVLGGRFGLEKFGAVGDVFDPNLHDALMANTNPDVEEAVINQVLQVGFKVGDRVLRPTKVIVDNPA